VQALQVLDGAGISDPEAKTPDPQPLAVMMIRSHAQPHDATDQPSAVRNRSTI
jgi:hypothetical protein